ncbi:MAG: nickel-binding protein [Thermoleophilaceae bacterium]
MRYLVESYLPAIDGTERDRVAARARAAVAELACDGAALRYVDAIFVPEDEMCLLVYEADWPELVREAGRRAGFSVERVLEAAGTSPDSA